jgi:hypothetical protein
VRYLMRMLLRFGENIKIESLGKKQAMPNLSYTISP